MYKYNKNYGFGDYRTIQDYPIRGRATYLHVRKRKWLDWRQFAGKNEQ
nr:transposase family protein [Duncaniella muris]